MWFSRRVITDVRRWLLLGLVCAGLIISLNFWVASLDTSTVANCRGIETLKLQFRTAIQQSLTQLGTPGSAGYAYYQLHPDELKAAYKQTLQTLQTFAPKKC